MNKLLLLLGIAVVMLSSCTSTTVRLYKVKFPATGETMVVMSEEHSDQKSPSFDIGDTVCVDIVLEEIKHLAEPRAIVIDMMSTENKD